MLIILTAISSFLSRTSVGFNYQTDRTYSDCDDKNKLHPADLKTGSGNKSHKETLYSFQVFKTVK